THHQHVSNSKSEKTERVCQSLAPNRPWPRLAAPLCRSRDARRRCFCKRSNRNIYADAGAPARFGVDGQLSPQKGHPVAHADHSETRVSRSTWIEADT